MEKVKNSIQLFNWESPWLWIAILVIILCVAELIYRSKRKKLLPNTQNQGSGTQPNPTPAPAPAATKKPWITWLTVAGCILLLFFFGKPAWHYFHHSWKDSENVVYKDNSTWWILTDEKHTDGNGWSEWVDIPCIDGGSINFHSTDGQVLMERENGDQFYMTSLKDSISFAAVPSHCTHPLEEVALNTKFRFKTITPGIKFVSMQFIYPPRQQAVAHGPIANQSNKAKESKPVKIFVIDFKKNKTHTSCTQRSQTKKHKGDKAQENTSSPHKWGRASDDTASQ